jgi:hypothetical protein
VLARPLTVESGAGEGAQGHLLDLEAPKDPGAVKATLWQCARKWRATRRHRPRDRWDRAASLT